MSGPGVAQLDRGGGGGAAVDRAPGGHGRVLRGAGARRAARRALHRGLVFNNRCKHRFCFYLQAPFPFLKAPDPDIVILTLL